MTLPDPDIEMVEIVSNLDRAWFEAHPTETVYVRKAYPGEFPYEPAPPGAGDQLVEVRQIAPGIRARWGYWHRVTHEPA